MPVNTDITPTFMYRCAGLLCELAKGMSEDEQLLTPEFVAKVAGTNNFTSDELKSLSDTLNLLSLMMRALVTCRDSVINQLRERIVKLEGTVRVLQSSKACRK